MLRYFAVPHPTRPAPGHLPPGGRLWYAIGIHGRKERMVIGIIGGGASGMAAALAAAENKDVQVVLMERQTRVGRKLLSTGNGRCNLTNLHAGEGSYHGNAP